MNPFIVSYTNKVKSYCEDLFYDNLAKIAGDRKVYIVDNSPDKQYYFHLIDRYVNQKRYNFEFVYADVSILPIESLFLRRVRDSANILRSLFLKTQCDSFFIIESDVLPPINIIDLFEKDILTLPENWGILGAIYHTQFHDYTLTGIQRIPDHSIALSGCTLYKRSVIEENEFRWDKQEIGRFPDGWMSIDAQSKYTIWNNYDIICEHYESWGKPIL